MGNAAPLPAEKLVPTTHYKDWPNAIGVKSKVQMDAVQGLTMTTSSIQLMRKDHQWS